MITRFLIASLLVILLISGLYKVSCEKEKKNKLEMLGATREELGNSEQAVIECKLAVRKIEDEIASLRDKIVEKKLIELRECKAVFDSKINAYKLTHTAATGTTPSNSQIEAMKTRLGSAI